MKFIEKINAIQCKLVANKTLFNKFGGYKYRSLESILESLKPLLAEHKLVITISDEVIPVLDRVYVRSTASITDGTDSITNTAYAREPLNKKGMDEAQITGSTSSYARKYAISGLLAIDDNADPDSTNKHEEESNLSTADIDAVYQTVMGFKDRDSIVTYMQSLSEEQKLSKVKGKTIKQLAIQQMGVLR